MMATKTTTTDIQSSCSSSETCSSNLGTHPQHEAIASDIADSAADVDTTNSVDATNNDENVGEGSNLPHYKTSSSERSSSTESDRNTAFFQGRRGRDTSTRSTVRPMPPQVHNYKQHHNLTPSKRKMTPTNTIDITSTTISLLILFTCIAWIIWHYYFSAKRRKDWESSSAAQLDKIRSRSLEKSDYSETTAERVVTAGSKPSATSHISHEHEKNDIFDTESERSNVKIDEYVKKGPASKEEKLETLNLSCAQNDAPNNVYNGGYVNGEIPSPSTEQNSKVENAHPPMEQTKNVQNLSNIRLQQQESYEKLSKYAQKQKRQQIKERQKKLHQSLQHDAADEANRRRASAIEADRVLLVESMPPNTSSISNITEQQQNNERLSELEEIERIALLQQQDLEYEESLRKDRERDLRREIYLRRTRLVEDAKNRLFTAGVQCDGLSLDPGERIVNGQERDAPNITDSSIHIRLLLPSGKKQGGMFSLDHSIGLVYDLALVILGSMKLLWSEEDNSSDVMGVSSIATNGSEMNSASKDDPNNEQHCENQDSESSPIDLTNYDCIREEWNNVFSAFSIVSTFPRQKYDDFSISLRECGLSRNVMFMVVIDGD